MEKARRPMSFGRLPVSASAAQLPVIPVNRWDKSTGRLQKSYEFQDIPTRNRFVSTLMEYESEVGHNAVITLDELKVTLLVYTKDVDVITELDKEYASAADTTYKDVVYSRSDAGRNRK